MFILLSCVHSWSFPGPPSLSFPSLIPSSLSSGSFLSLLFSYPHYDPIHIWPRAREQTAHFQEAFLCRTSFLFLLISVIIPCLPLTLTPCPSLFFSLGCHIFLLLHSSYHLCHISCPLFSFLSFKTEESRWINGNLMGSRVCRRKEY